HRLCSPVGLMERIGISNGLWIVVPHEDCEQVHGQLLQAAGSSRSIEMKRIHRAKMIRGNLERSGVLVVPPCIGEAVQENCVRCHIPVWRNEELHKAPQGHTLRTRSLSI